MRPYFTSDALLPQGWRRNVRIEVDRDGDIAAVTADASPKNADRHDVVRHLGRIVDADHRDHGPRALRRLECCER